MAEPGALDYFYGTEAEQYTFYRIPKVLFTDPGFRRITADAKILYGLMLDRMGLSIRNGWLDEQERVFIYFTLEEAMDAMCCGHNKAVSLFTELDKVGLIERKKQGQGRPTKIYVKNFTIAGKVGKTPEQWNSGVFSMIHSLSESVIVPIAGLVIAAVLSYELIRMVIDRNNMHDFDTFIFFKWIIKAGIAAYVVSHV